MLTNQLLEQIQGPTDLALKNEIEAWLEDSPSWPPFLKPVAFAKVMCRRLCF